MPKIMLQALHAAYGDPGIRLVHELVDWKLERGECGQVILTFSVGDHFDIAIAISDQELTGMAEAAAQVEAKSLKTRVMVH